MLTQNNFRRFLTFFLWVVMAMPGVITARQATEPKVDPFRAGMNGVTTPGCIYCPQPEYSQKMRKVKIEGTVLLDVTITTDGQITNPVVLKGADVGLNNKALEWVRHWKMKPASGPDGKPVDCRVQVEMTTHRY